jgi:hypothetical protein
VGESASDSLTNRSLRAANLEEPAAVDAGAEVPAGSGLECSKTMSDRTAQKT